MMTTARLLVLTCALMMAGCAGESSDDSLYDTSGPLWAVKRYYEQRATEFRVNCTEVRFGRANFVETLEETEDRLVLKVTYSFRSRSRGEAMDSVRGCHGLNTRIFTLEKLEDRYEVIEMSAPLDGFTAARVTAARVTVVRHRHASPSCVTVVRHRRV